MMVSRYSNRFSGNQPLDNDMLKHYAPSIFAETPWQGNGDKRGMSNKYAFIPTIQVVDAMRKEGFIPIKASQGKSRIEGKGEFTKHMVRFRLPEALAVDQWKIGSVLPELVLINSHDGTSSYQVSAGLFRLVCLNGMMVEDANCGTYRTNHKGDIAGEVLEATYSIVNELPAIESRVADWQHLPVTDQQQRVLAEAAIGLRWEPEEAPIRPELLLHTRRRDDAEPTLWNTFQKVQENLIKGGLPGRNASGNRQRTRAVNSVSEDTRLNRALWSLTEKMGQLLHA